jgi:hypothetical protein
VLPGFPTLNRSWYRRLLEGGVRVFEAPGMWHEKLVLTDASGVSISRAGSVVASSTPFAFADSDGIEPVPRSGTRPSFRAAGPSGGNTSPTDDGTDGSDRDGVPNSFSLNSSAR